MDRFSCRAAADIMGPRHATEFVVRHRQRDRLRPLGSGRHRSGRPDRSQRPVAPFPPAGRGAVHRRTVDRGDFGAGPDPQSICQRRGREPHGHPLAVHQPRGVLRLRPQPVHVRIPARIAVSGPVQYSRRGRCADRSAAFALGAGGVGRARPAVAAGRVPHVVDVDYRRVSDRDGAARLWLAAGRRRLGAAASDHFPVRDDHAWRARRAAAALSGGAAAAYCAQLFCLSLRLSRRVAALHPHGVGDRCCRRTPARARRRSGLRRRRFTRRRLVRTERRRAFRHGGQVELAWLQRRSRGARERSRRLSCQPPVGHRPRSAPRRYRQLR